MNGQTEQRFRILVIDDNEAIHNDLRRILCAGNDDAGSLSYLEMELFGDTKEKITDSQFDLKCALQGQEGFELVKEAVAENDPFTLAFVDVRMPPGWDGIETIANIRQVDQEMQVVICTAYSDYSSDEIIAKVGNVDNLFILKKPFDNVEILQMANALTKKWSLNRELQGRMSDLESMVKQRTQALEQANDELRRQTAEREQLYAERQLDRSLKAVGQLAEGITQELAQPVQKLSDNFKSLKDIDLLKQDESSNQLIIKIEEQLKRVHEVVQAAVEVGQTEQSIMVQADLNKMLTNALILTRYQYKQVAEVEVDLGEIPKIVCNASQINQVFVNLLTNAAIAMAERYEETQEKKSIKISSSQEGEQIVVTIQDQGKGIPEDFKDIYERVLTTKELGKYAGQGLAIARSIIVEGHKGQFDFKSHEKEGTTITIRLPINPTA